MEVKKFFDDYIRMNGIDYLLNVLQKSLDEAIKATENGHPRHYREDRLFMLWVREHLNRLEEDFPCEELASMYQEGSHLSSSKKVAEIRGERERLERRLNGKRWSPWEVVLKYENSKTP